MSHTSAGSKNPPPDALSPTWRWVFFLVSLALLLVVSAVFFAEWNKAWRQQVRAHPSWSQEPIEIVTTTGAVDRCATCHQDLLNFQSDNPHPWQLFQAHPPRVMGCVLCHGGDGRALDKKRAHSSVGPLRMLPKSQRGVACARCHLPGTIPETQELLRGLQVFRALGCATCHRVAGAVQAADAQAGVGPDLDHLSSWSSDDVKLALREPRHVFGPLTEMPSFAGDLDRDPQGANALLSWLASQRGVEQMPRAHGDSALACIACHSVSPARGFTAHQCSWIRAQGTQWSCARCHSGEFLSASRPAGATCAYIDLQRSACAYCHQTTTLPQHSNEVP